MSRRGTGSKAGRLRVTVDPRAAPCDARRFRFLIGIECVENPGYFDDSGVARDRAASSESFLPRKVFALQDRMTPQRVSAICLVLHLSVSQRSTG